MAGHSTKMVVYNKFLQCIYKIHKNFNIQHIMRVLLSVSVHTCIQGQGSSEALCRLEMKTTAPVIRLALQYRFRDVFRYKCCAISKRKVNILQWCLFYKYMCSFIQDRVPYYIFADSLYPFLMTFLSRTRMLCHYHEDNLQYILWWWPYNVGICSQLYPMTRHCAVSSGKVNFL